MTRRALRVAWLLLLCLAQTPVLAQTPALAQATPGKVTIATYNVENMFDVFDDPYTSDEQTRVKPRGELEKVARLIHELNPDVAVFQEVENEGVLKAFVRELLADAGYKYVTVSQTNSRRGMRLGLISRLPIVSVSSYRYLDLTLPGDDRHWRFARNLMQVRLQVTATRTLDLFTVHFKSRLGAAADPTSAGWRLAEATAARRIIDDHLAADPDAWVMLAGDCNDMPDSPPIAALLTPTDGKAAALIDLHAAMAPPQRITYLRPPYRSTIDYMLASAALARRAVKGSPRVVHDEALLGGSDHAPLVVTFDVGEAE